jgi:hypothetical protein
MTKISITVVPHRIAFLGLPVVVPIGTTADELVVWPATSSAVSNFEFRLLEFICYLIFGA